MSAVGEAISVRINAPFGRAQSAPVPLLVPSPPQPCRAARQLALAHWIDRKIESGELRDLAHAASVLGVTRARMTQIANLLLLPAAMQERVMSDAFQGSERDLRHTPT